MPPVVTDQHRHPRRLARFGQRAVPPPSVSATGFSTRQGIPRSMQASPAGRCNWLGSATMAPSGSVASSMAAYSA